jgi:hypothetical protein
LAYLGAFSAVAGISVHIAIDLGTAESLDTQGRDLSHRRWLQVIQLITWAIILTITGVVVTGGASSLTHMPIIITDSGFSDALTASQMLLIASITLGVVVGVVGRVFDYLGAIERVNTPQNNDHPVKSQH